MFLHVSSAISRELSPSSNTSPNSQSQHGRLLQKVGVPYKLRFFIRSNTNIRLLTDGLFHRGRAFTGQVGMWNARIHRLESTVLSFILSPMMDGRF